MEAIAAYHTDCQMCKFQRALNRRERRLSVTALFIYCNRVACSRNMPSHASIDSADLQCSLALAAYLLARHSGE